VSPAAERALRGGHPWLFADQVREQNREGACGELAVVYDRQDRFLAGGLYDPDSPICVRTLVTGKPRLIDAAWWQDRLQQALARREGLFDPTTNGYRCLNGESDGWPGLVLDRYDSTLVLKIYTCAWLPRLPEILPLLQERLQPRTIVLRLSRNLQEKASRLFSLADGQVLWGQLDSEIVTFLESGLRFEAAVVRGQKTGFFLDQRENRREVGRFAAGKHVLNTFSFSGGFSLYAARGGALSVTDIDISQHALESARRNFALNRFEGSVAACPHTLEQADAFDWLRESRKKFDLVVVDPPSLAKRATDQAAALRGYRELLTSAIQRLHPRGVLVACSCSAHVRADEFFELARAIARNSRRAFTELQTTAHAPDHPASFPEAAYLKAIYLRF
jgi:23S rRNA (cytosine1962-C5)-methyltransferase